MTELAEDEEVAYKAKDDLSDAVLIELLMAAAEELDTDDVEVVLGAIAEDPDLKEITVSLEGDSGCSSSSEPSVGPPSKGKSGGGPGGGSDALDECAGRGEGCAGVISVGTSSPRDRFAVASVLPLRTEKGETQ